MEAVFLEMIKSLEKYLGMIYIHAFPESG